ncbi:hypothetical protein D9M69_505510 [compost metagenome]
MSKNSRIFGDIGRHIKLKQPGQNASVPARINDEFRCDLTGFSAFIPDGGHRVCTLKPYIEHLGFKFNIHALPDHLLRQGMVKIGPWRLPGPVPPFPEFITKIKIAYFFAPDKPGTCFYLKVFGLQSLQQARFFVMFHGPWKEAFSDHKSGKSRFFHHLYLYPVIKEISRCHTT